MFYSFEKMTGPIDTFCWQEGGILQSIHDEWESSGGNYSDTWRAERKIVALQKYYTKTNVPIEEIVMGIELKFSQQNFFVTPLYCLDINFVLRALILCRAEKASYFDKGCLLSYQVSLPQDVSDKALKVVRISARHKQFLHYLETGEDVFLSTRQQTISNDTTGFS